MAVPTLTPIENKTRDTFLVLMWALSNPGRICTLPQGVIPGIPAFTAIGETLLDLETSFYTPDDLLAQVLTRTTARSVAPGTAAYHFYPEFAEVHLSALEKAPIGTLLYPDQSATVVIDCQFETGQNLTLSGPGIQTTKQIQIARIPPAVWALRQQTTRYPLGWDIFLLSGNQVIGIPRSTLIELAD
jgi:alpha-D-ribose 1-methylphosphonate 5-triphosphate synthase subunit PhnH